MESENIEIVKKLIREVLEKMTFSDFTVGVREDNGSSGGKSIIFNIGIKESDLLIGQYGVNLRSLQFIIRSMARRKTDEKLKFSIDVNDYNRQKIRSIVELARSMARQAIADGRAVILRPMSAYERRIVHMELARERRGKNRKHRRRRRKKSCDQAN